MSCSFRCASTRTFATFTLFFFTSTFVGQPCLSQDEDPLKALQMFEVASGLQQAKRFDRAAVQYATIIRQYSDAKVAAEAHYQMGICQFEVGKYKPAATNFDSFLEHKHRDSNKTFIPYALYNLGLSCYEIARNSQNEDGKSVERAIKAFDRLEKEHPKSELVDQGIFFRSQARFLINDLEGAIQDLQKIVDSYPQSGYFGAALIDLGTANVELGKFAEAAKVYDQFLETRPSDPSTNEVKLRRLDCQLQLAIKSESSEQQNAKEGFAKLSEEYQLLASIEGFELAYHAMQQQAYCLAKSGAFLESAKLYESVASNFSDNPDTQLAKLNAARNYELAGGTDKAAELLLEITKSQPNLAIEAAWMLCSIDLNKKQYDAAYQRANEISEKSKESRFHAPILFIQAQAAFHVANKVDESTALFKQIANEYSDQPIAAEALYNATFNQLQQRDTGDVHTLATAFGQKYKNSSYYPEVIELDAEAFLLDQQRDQAQTKFQKLVSEFPEHPLAGKWTLRLAETLSLQGENADAIALIKASMDRFTTTTQKANAFYLVGLSQFNNNETQSAADSLRKSIETDSKWKYAPAVQLLRARTAMRMQEYDLASQFIKNAIKEYPKATNRDEMYFRAGQIAEGKNALDDAATAYENVVTQFSDSTWMPEALYKLGWVNSKQNNHREAGEQFSKLINDFPKHSLSTDALLARGISRRLAGEIAPAIKDLKQFLSVADENSNRPAASYELALAFAADGKHKEVTETLIPLLQINPKPTFIDDIHYELGWSYKELDDAKKSIEQFRNIVEDYPDSSHTAEANFHVGESYYSQKDYETSAAFYAACIDKASDDSLKEKGAYKAAWALYHQEQYDQSFTAFEKQVDWYPDGPLSADGKFMMAESKFKAKEFADALMLYRAAIPALDQSATTINRVKRLARLHGAQSANKSKDYKSAIELATYLTDDENADYYHEGYFELGDALYKQNENEKAKNAWAESAKVNNKVGARSNYMLGEMKFGDKDYDSAIADFELVVFGYGGTNAPDDIKVWQALAAYEIARCYHVRIKGETNADRRSKMTKDAISSYEYVVKHFPSNKDLSKQSQKAIADLKRLQ